jgi:hypothetical protein
MMTKPGVCEPLITAQYPSWRDPVVALKCDRCGHEIALAKRGRAGLSHARAVMRSHPCLDSREVQR